MPGIFLFSKADYPAFRKVVLRARIYCPNSRRDRVGHLVRTGPSFGDAAYSNGPLLHRNWSGYRDCRQSGLARALRDLDRAL